MELYDRPVIVLEPGLHVAPIFRADADRARRFVVTGSHDKTVRVWSIRDGKLLRTIRIPAGPGSIGRIDAVALSPSGDLIAAGGFTNAKPPNSIYIFDRSSGEMADRIGNLPNLVFHLTFSPDGRFLAAMLADKGVRVYDRAAGWAEIARDENYDGRSYGAAFAPDGRLATTSMDGYIRLYDSSFSLIHKTKPSGGNAPFGIAFSPDGEKLAIGFDDTAKVALLNGQSLDPLSNPDSSDFDYGNLLSVAWSQDGKTLFAAGSYNHDMVSVVVSWPDSGLGQPKARPLLSGTVMSVIGLTDGAFLAASQAPNLGHFESDGRPNWLHRQAQADYRAQSDHLAISDDGMKADFGYEYPAQSPARFDLESLALTTTPPNDGTTQTPIQWGPETEEWINELLPVLGEKIGLYEKARSFAIHPDLERITMGTDWFIRTFDKEGEELWRQPAAGGAWATNISGDGRLVVAAHGDGTIRWRSMENGKELLAFFPVSDQERWIAWTPEGYYASSEVEGTGAIIGWHVNRGWNRSADFFPISAVKGFYQPDLMPIVVQELETARALGIAKIAHDRERVQDVVKSEAPPGAQLHVLAVGVSEYANHDHLTLDFADDDATDIAKALSRQEGSLYARVNIQHLVNESATRAGFLTGLNTIRTSMRADQEDVAVILFSGHGAEVDDSYYLLPHDVRARDDTEIGISGIEVDQLRRLLSKMGEYGKVLVLLDACHSGSFSGGTKNIAPDVERIRDELTAAGNGVVVLTSSSEREVSIENPDWKNGAFTEALLEALNGKADYDGDRWISVAELQGYVVDRVRALTGNRQNPRISNPSGTQFQSRLFVLTE